MESDSADRGLLLGIVALDRKWIEPHELARVAGRWTEDKSKSIKDLLIELEVLTAEQVQSLERELDAEVAQSDSGSSSDFLSRADQSMWVNLRGALDRIDDVDLDASIDRLRLSAGDSDVVKSGSRFEIVEMHARGGLGEVFVARDRQLNRRVAVKQIKEQWATDENCSVRFMQEAEITGRLEHPGIVPVYAFGRKSSGQPYYAMRFIRGESLADGIYDYHHASYQDPYQLRQLLRRFVDVCNTIDYAHSRGVIHRDIKPANIMLGKYGETIMVDWGLAKQMDRDDPVAASLTESLISPQSDSGVTPTQLGSALGTPHYMSPEQAAGRLDELGPTSDIFSLGATLYHILTGTPPYLSKDIDEVIAAARDYKLRTPKECIPGCDRALESICLKAMAEKPYHRFSSAGALASEIELWLANEPVSSYRESIVERFWRFTRRAPLLAISLLLLVILLNAAVVGGYLIWQRVHQLEFEHQAEITSQAQIQRAAKEQQDQQTFHDREQNAQNNWRLGLEELRDGDLAKAKEFLQRSLEFCSEESRLEPLKQSVESRIAQVESLEYFRSEADLGIWHSLLGSSEQAIASLESALGRLGVFKEADWWTQLPDDGLSPKSRLDLQRDVHFALTQFANSIAASLYDSSRLRQRTAGIEPAPASAMQRQRLEALRQVVVLSDRYAPSQWLKSILGLQEYSITGRRDVAKLPQQSATFADAQSIAWFALATIQHPDKLSEFAQRWNLSDAPETAVQSTEQMVATRGDFVWSHFLAALAYANAQNWQAVEQSAKACLTLRPEFKPGQYLAALAYWRLAQAAREASKKQLLHSALHSATQASRMRPATASTFWLLALIHRDLENREDAILALKEAIRLEPSVIARTLLISNPFSISTDPPIANTELAFLLPDRWMAATDILARFESDENETRDLLGTQIAARIDLLKSEPERALQRIQELKTSDVGSASIAGAALRSLGRVKESEQILRQAFKDGQGNIDVRFELGLTLAALKQTSQARSLFQTSELTAWQKSLARFELAKLESATLGPSELQFDVLRRLDHGLNIAILRKQLPAVSEATWNQLSNRVLKTIFGRQFDVPIRSPALLNGDFELHGAAWTAWQNQGSSRSIAHVEQRSNSLRDSDRVLKIVHQSTQHDDSFGECSQTIAVSPTLKYQVTVWVESSGADEGSVGIYVNDQTQPIVSIPAGSYTWKKLTGEFKVEQQGSSSISVATIRIRSNNRSDCSINDMKIRSVLPLGKARSAIVK